MSASSAALASAKIPLSGGAFCVGTLKTPLVSQVMFALTMIPVRTPLKHWLNPCTPD